MTYAIVRTGGKQYRVEQGQSLLVERLPANEGDKVALEPLFLRDGDKLVDGDDLAKATVAAKVVGHERGPKIRVLKFKPKRGYKRRSGHRQALTRLEVTEIKVGARRSSAGRKPAAKSGDGADKPRAKSGDGADKPRTRRSPARKPAGKES